MLNEGIIGPQYTRMKDPEMCKMSCYSCSLKIFFAGTPLVDDDLLKVTNPPRL